MSRSSFFGLICAAACSSPSATLVMTTGGETDALTKSPAVATMELDVVDRTGAPTVILAKTPIASSGSTVDLGDVSQTLVGSIEFTGRDSAGDAVVFGSAPFAEIGALSGDVPLFVQRKGELARMPNGIADARRDPLLAISARALYVAGGTIDGQTGDPALVGYDLLNLVSILSTFAAPQHATSFAVVELDQETSAGDLALAIWMDGTGLTVVGLGTAGEYYGASTSEPTLPDGIAWSDIAGGTTVMGDDGTAYFVGASAAFAFLPTNAGEAQTIATRQRPAVAWAPNFGVFLFGGTVDTNTRGAELVDATLVEHALPYDPDPTQNLAAAVFDDHTMLVAGAFSDLQPRTVDLKCQNACAPQAWGAPLPAALTSPSLFALGNQTFLLVGDDASGATRVFRLDATSSNEIALKIGRSAARAIQSQTGAVLIVGGGTETIESYAP